MAPVDELAIPKLPHAVTQTAYEGQNTFMLELIESIIQTIGCPTLTDPKGARPLPFPLSVSAKPKLYFPSFFPSIVQDRANVSSVWAVIISSQSLAREEEYDSDVMGGNLREARGIDKAVAFLARDPYPFVVVRKKPRYII